MFQGDRYLFRFTVWDEGEKYWITSDPDVDEDLLFEEPRASEESTSVELRKPKGQPADSNLRSLDEVRAAHKRPTGNSEPEQ